MLYLEFRPMGSVNTADIGLHQLCGSADSNSAVLTHA